MVHLQSNTYDSTEDLSQRFLRPFADTKQRQLQAYWSISLAACSFASLTLSMDLELFSTQEAFTVARTLPVGDVHVDVDVAIQNLNPILAIALAGVVVASVRFVIQKITRWIVVATTRNNISDVYAAELSPSSISVEHVNLQSAVSKLVTLLELTISYCSSRKARTLCQVRSVVRGHVN